MTITDFLLARIYEDEAIASRAPGDREWEADPSQANPEIGQVVSNDGAVASGVLRDDAHHIARWDPARVLAECAAKRRIVAQ